MVNEKGSHMGVIVFCEHICVFIYLFCLASNSIFGLGPVRLAAFNLNT